MIEPASLRLGNKLSLKGEIITVRSIEVNQINGEYYIRSYEKSMSIKIGYLQPIPLTEELLLMFGFVKIKNKIDIFELSRLRVWIGSRGVCLAYLIEEDTTNGHYIPIVLEYAHTLQNLTYSLTNQELKLEG